MRALFTIPVFLFISLPGTAQDITGVWTGYLKTSESKLEYELAISNTKGKLTGYALTIYTVDGFENSGVKITRFSQKKIELEFEDGQLIYENYRTTPRRVKLMASVILQGKDSLMTLSGVFKTRSLDFRDTRIYEGEIFLQKNNRPLTTKIIAKLKLLNLLHTLSFLNPPELKKDIATAKQKDSAVTVSVTKPVIVQPNPEIKNTETRKTDIINTVFFSSDSLLLSLVDNGAIDGDTVSIVANGKTIVDRAALTSEAYRFVLPVDSAPGDSLLIIMYAENLGAIPPNTGLLIIQDGDRRHEIRFEGDLQKSSAVMLKRKR